MLKVLVLLICVASVGCKSAAEKEQEDRLRARPASVEGARVAADKHEWSSAVKALDAAGAISPLSEDETQLRRMWAFQMLLDTYCAGKVEDLLSHVTQLSESIPAGLDAATLAKANQLFARRELIRQLRELREKQQALSDQANLEPNANDDCEKAISDVQSARSVTLNIVRRVNSDYGPGIYDVQDATGRAARLTTTDTAFNMTGWVTLVAYAFNDYVVVELSAARRAQAQRCVADRANTGAARVEFARSSQLLDAKMAALANEFSASCINAAKPSPPPNQPEPPANATAAAVPSLPEAPTGTTAASAPPPDAAPTPPLHGFDVERLVKAQAASLTSTAEAFIDSFDAHAVVFFPHSLTLYEGREKIIDGLRAAWRPDNVDASDVVVGLSPNFAWATAQWRITLSGSKTVLPIRVTEVITKDATGLHVVAASFSVPPPAGATGIGEPIPTPAGGAPAAADSDAWLARPVELSQHLRDDAATVVIGSDAKEFALGSGEARTLLASWKNVKLEFVGNVRAIEGPGYRVVLGYARWAGPKPTLFRVLALFVRGEAMVGPAPWELATAQYSVAVPTIGARTTTASTQSGLNCTVATLGCDQFSAHGQTGKKLHALVFAAEQAGRHAEAICLAQPNLDSSDKWLAGAANFDSSRAWDGLGCHEQAIAAIETSLAVRQRDQGGWKETCEQCRKLDARCAACAVAAEVRTTTLGEWCCCREVSGTASLSDVKSCTASQGTCATSFNKECDNDFALQRGAEERKRPN